jgi:hypothetical protein
VTLALFVKNSFVEKNWRQCTRAQAMPSPNHKTKTASPGTNPTHNQQTQQLIYPIIIHKQITTMANENESRLRSRENAIETLIDMHPRGAAYRAARIMVGWLVTFVLAAAP